MRRFTVARLMTFVAFVAIACGLCRLPVYLIPPALGAEFYLSIRLGSSRAEAATVVLILAVLLALLIPAVQTSCYRGRRRMPNSSPASPSVPGASRGTVSPEVVRVP